MSEIRNFVKVDTHSHTCFSGDSTTTLNEFIEAAEKTDLNYIAVTDHGTISGALKLKEVEDQLKFKIIVGQEQKVAEGELIGLFLEKRIPPGLGLISTAKFIKDQGGIVTIPHPFDSFRHSLKRVQIETLAGLNLVDAIETFNSKTKQPSSLKKAVAIADELKLLRVGGSDSHVPLALGSSLVLMQDFTDAKTFLKSLSNSQVIGRFSDPPRRWENRLVTQELLPLDRN